MAVLTAIVGVTALSIAGPARAQQPNCPISHSVHPYSDNTGGGWQLELDARCAAFQQSGTTGIEWSFRFWAETYGGERVIRYFNGDVTGPEVRELDGPRHYVGVGAPLGYPRYCYSAHVVFKGLPTTPFGKSDPLGYALGTHCRHA